MVFEVFFLGHFPQYTTKMNNGFLRHFATLKDIKLYGVQFFKNCKLVESYDE